MSRRIWLALGMLAALAGAALAWGAGRWVWQRLLTLHGH